MKIKKSSFISLKWSIVGLLLINGLFSETAQAADKRFEATGMTVPRRVAGGRDDTRSRIRPVSVSVTFDLLPAKLEFILPSFPTLVTENGYRYSNCYTETYDPEAQLGDDGHKWFQSFEVMQDRENRYSRIWIDTQSNARIVVRERGAQCDNNYTIAHTDIPSGSPYGEGDWTDEWYYIYPDGTHVRHVRIYTGLSMDSRPFGYDRRPPDVVHEFQESTPMWQDRRKQLDEIDINALTLIKMSGESKNISYVPYPQNFGDFKHANIQVVNFRSQYKPFTIARYEGVILQPLDARAVPPGRTFGYALGHVINFKHYKQTDNTLEQVYLQGWSHTSDPAAELVPLAKSWLHAPELQLKSGFSSQFTNEGYDLTQRAYILSCKKKSKSSQLEFELTANNNSPVVNPAFVIKDWGKADIVLQIDGKRIERGTNFRYGLENDTDLIIWLKYESTNPVQIEIS